MKKILLCCIILICFMGCSSIKWSGQYKDKSFCICATIDSLKLGKLTSKQFETSLQNQIQLKPAEIDSLVKALLLLKKNK
jgi:hypothetical protein